MCIRVLFMWIVSNLKCKIQSKYYICFFFVIVVDDIEEKKLYLWLRVQHIKLSLSTHHWYCHSFRVTNKLNICSVSSSSLNCSSNNSSSSIMADVVVDLGTLPEEIREKLAELDLELSEGNWLWFLFILWMKKNCQRNKIIQIITSIILNM